MPSYVVQLSHLQCKSRFLNLLLLSRGICFVVEILDSLSSSPIRTDFETLSFQTQEPGPASKPQRPIGESGCSDFHCSPKLLEFVKATNVKISLYQHTLVTHPRHNYFGLRRVLVSGT